MFPSENNSLLAAASSVLRHYGAQHDHASLPLLDAYLDKGYKNVVVMLLDGLGDEILKIHQPEDGFFRRNQKAVISSVFPATTTAATTTMQTGLSPIEHGWLGWALYFDEVNANVNVYPNTIQGSDGRQAADYNLGWRHLKFTDITEKIGCATCGEVEARIVSPFSEYKVESFREICGHVRDICAREGRKYIYTYWHQPDYDMHNLGTRHENISKLISELSRDAEALCENLRDTLVVITADHGLIDTEYVRLFDFPEVSGCISRLPSVESRALSFFLKEGMAQKFKDAFWESFGAHYLLFSKEEVILKNLFGSGAPHGRSYGFIGDFLAVATGGVTIDANPSKNSTVFKAAHAGITPDEINVPLIIIER